MSPLSDTTNLAALVTRVNIFSHIKHMIWTTVPASIIGLIVWHFASSGFAAQAKESQVNGLLKDIEAMYHINFFVWLPLIAIVICLVAKISTVPSMLISSVVAILVGWLDHGFKLQNGFIATFKGFSKDMLVTQSDLSKKAITLIEQGGMMSMTQIIVTIFCGYAFAGIVEKAGCLDVLLHRISKNVNTVGQLILVTVIGGLMMVLAAGVASVVIIMVGVLMMQLYDKMGLDLSLIHI